LDKNAIIVVPIGFDGIDRDEFVPHRNGGGLKDEAWISSGLD
jgi:hypothetical protein